MNAKKLTEAQRRELTLIADEWRISPGVADNLRVARSLEKRGLVVLVREWTEWEGGIGNRGAYIRYRRYRITEAGRAALRTTGDAK